MKIFVEMLEKLSVKRMCIILLFVVSVERRPRTLDQWKKRGGSFEEGLRQIQSGPSRYQTHSGFVLYDI